MIVENINTLNENQIELLNSLADRFTTKDFIDVCKSKHIAERTAYYWLNQFSKLKFVEKTGPKTFKKVTVENSSKFVQTADSGKSKLFTVTVDKVTDIEIDEQKGTGTIKGTLIEEPLSGEEIVSKFKIDTSKWTLVQYWNKEKPGGGYFVSANIMRVKHDEINAINIQESIKNVFGNLKIKPINLPDVISNDKALFVYTSDKHIGAYVSDKAIYENNYDAYTFNNRMESLLKEILYMVDVFGVFEDIYVIDLGDSLDGQSGQTTRGGHKLPQNMNDREAYETYLMVHKKFFDSLFQSGASSKYHVYNVTEDNHSGDFGYFASRTLEVYLNTRYPEVSTKIFQKFMDHFTHGNHTFIITHGKDSEDMKHGFPLVLNDKVENFINKYIKYHKISSPYIHLIKGDLHQEASQDTADFRYRNVLSMFGSSKWMMNNFSASNKGGTSMEVVEKNTHRIFPHKIMYN